MRKRRWILGTLAAICLAPAAVWAVPDSVSEPGEAVSAALRVPATLDVVSIGELSGLSRATELAAVEVARQSGAAALTTRGASIGMVRLVRGAGVVQQPPQGYLLPMGVSVVPIDLAQVVMSARVADVVQRGETVLGETSAALRGAQIGDIAELMSSHGAVVPVRIGLIAPDAEVGGTEFVVSPATADRLGVTIVTRIILWGFDSRESFESAFAAAAFDPFKVRAIRSWSAPSPDATIGMARTKQLLGEFAYREHATGVSLTPGWSDQNIVTRERMADIAIRAACHRVVQPALQGALTEVARRGLAGEIDVANSNAVGGCFVPRFNRVTGNLGSLSRHTWGQAIDINISQNPLGSIPKLNCDVVRIFRKWGFAWGGNFVSLDGMHFEYVGEPRDQFNFPSRFCPNIITSLVNTPADVENGRSRLFADDGLSIGE